jgi:hypothetical protein
MCLQQADIFLPAYGALDPTDSIPAQQHTIVCHYQQAGS